MSGTNHIPKQKECCTKECVTQVALAMAGQAVVFATAAAAITPLCSLWLTGGYPSALGWGLGVGISSASGSALGGCFACVCFESSDKKKNQPGENKPLIVKQPTEDSEQTFAA